MLRLLIVAVTGVAACTPTLNWRDVPIAPAGLTATLPCKPSRAERSTEIAPGRPVVLHAHACEAGGATFAVLYAELERPAESAAALAQWRAASLATMHGVPVDVAPFQPPGALGLPESVRVRAQGRRADGRAVESQAAYFARDGRVFQAVIYAERITPEMSDPFFEGLRLE